MYVIGGNAVPNCEESISRQTNYYTFHLGSKESNRYGRTNESAQSLGHGEFGIIDLKISGGIFPENDAFFLLWPTPDAFCAVRYFARE